MAATPPTARTRARRTAAASAETTASVPSSPSSSPARRTRRSTPQTPPLNQRTQTTRRVEVAVTPTPASPAGSFHSTASSHTVSVVIDINSDSSEGSQKDVVVLVPSDSEQSSASASSVPTRVTRVTRTKLRQQQRVNDTNRAPQLRIAKRPRANPQATKVATTPRIRRTRGGPSAASAASIKDEDYEFADQPESTGNVNNTPRLSRTPTKRTRNQVDSEPSSDGSDGEYIAKSDSDSDYVDSITSRVLPQDRPLTIASTSNADVNGSFDNDEVDEEPVNEVSDTESEDDVQVQEAPRRRTQRAGQRSVMSPAARAAKAEERRKAREINDLVKIHDHHPELVTVWSELEENSKNLDTRQAPQPEEVTISLLPFQKEGLNWLIKQENDEQFRGGILADEMGMGKTIQTIALLVSKRLKPNLIICPTVAIMQWFAELKGRTREGLMDILIYHGLNRTDDKSTLEKYDVVLTTYSLVEIGFRRERQGFTRNREKVYEKSLLHSVPWKRVILDEAHCIKDRSCSTARAVFALPREIQWSLSGTPLQNRVGELYSLVRFMKADPYSFYFCKDCSCKTERWSFSDYRHCDECGHISHRHFCWWNLEILKPIQRYGATGEGILAFEKLGKLLDRIMLRRTKVQRTKELGLPPRVVRVRKDYFSRAEEELYDSLYSDSVRTFSTYVDNHTVLNNYASIFSLLSRMRLAVNHPDLVTTKVALANNSAKENRVCGICHDIAEDPIVSKCHHIFCREDIRQYMECSVEQVTRCPTCFKALSIDLSQPEMSPDEKMGPLGATHIRSGLPSSIVNYIDMSKWRSSTKIEALVEELTALQKEESTSKSIVFSQFVAFLDLIHWRLSRAGFNVVKLDGRMGPQQRDAVIRLFMTDPTVTVFLVSLKAGGVALNLTEASNVFIMDPWWNPAVEDQAFDRIHRLGQYRPIRITRMIIENSIESRILQLQEKKQALFASTVGKDMNALARLSEDDLRFLFVL